jgi:hypothetical protein
MVVLGKPEPPPNTDLLSVVAAHGKANLSAAGWL